MMTNAKLRRLLVERDEEIRRLRRELEAQLRLATDLMELSGTVASDLVAEVEVELLVEVSR